MKEREGIIEGTRRDEAGQNRALQGSSSRGRAGAEQSICLLR